MSSTVPRDPYQVLGVARDADESVIKKAFRKLARELHPDVNSHDPQAEEKFKEAAEAYEILNDSDRRAVYDRHGHDGLRSGGMGPNFDGFGSISDLFDAFFGGGGGGGHSQGDDVGIAASITLTEAAHGVRVPVSFEAVDRCGTCHGNRAQPGTPIVTCERCGGSGRLQAVSRTPFGQVVRALACDVCGGDGKVAEHPCQACDGNGHEIRRRAQDVDIPAGIADGQRIRLSGEGHAGAAGGANGDLYVIVNVAPDERFLRDGDDLITVLDVPAPLAALGGTLPAPTIDGDADVELQAGTQPGQTITIRGQGMPVVQRAGRSGDLRVVVNVVIPRRLSKEQRRMLEAFAKTVTPENLRSDESMVSKLKRLFQQ